MNIEDPQNRSENLLYLAASQDYFARVGLWRRLQVLFIVLIPTAAAIYGATQKSPNFIVPFAGFASIILDAALFLPRIAENRYRAAQLAEVFDARIIGSEPSAVRAWNLPSRENVHTAAESYFKKPGAREELRTWYSERLEELSPAAAQLLCQRISCSWDEQLREQYTPWLATVMAIALVAVILIFGELNWSIPALVTNVLFPSAPAAAWTVREYIEQRSAQRHKVQLRHAIEQIWSHLMRPQVCDSETDRERDAVQGMHFTYRWLQPSVPGWMIRYNRIRQRQIFRVTIDAYVKDAVASGLGVGRSTSGDHTEGA